jgi:hypothetical protein
MSDFEIVEVARRTLLGTMLDRKLVGEPSWQALDEIERLGGVA